MSSRMRIAMLFPTLMAVCSQASAQELVWSNVRAQGGGDGSRCFYSDSEPSKNNVFWTSAGGELSVLFQSFGINLKPEQALFGRPLAKSASCRFEADVEIPQGYYLATLTQNLQVAIWKDKGTTGGISSNGFLFQNKIPLNQINVALLPQDKLPLSAAPYEHKNQQIFRPEQNALQCAATAFGPVRTKFEIRLLATGARVLPTQAFVMNVDANDIHFHYSAEPELRRCGQ